MLVSSKKVKAQNFTFEVDTVYTRYYTYKNAIILFKKDFKSIVAKEKSIEEYPVKIQRLLGGDFRGFNIAQVGSKCYLLNEELEFNFAKFINLKLKELSDSRQHFFVSKNKTAYVKNDSVFISNFDSHRTDFIIEDAIVSGLNENYIWIRSKSTNDGYIYVIQSRELKKLPNGYDYAVTNHMGFIRNMKYGNGLEVLDLNLYPIIKGSEGYTESLVKNNLLLIYGNQMPVRMFYK